MDERPGYNRRDWTAQPPMVHPPYRATTLRGPLRPLIPVPQTLSELTGPVFGHHDIGPLDHDLTRNAARNGEPLGERIVVAGRVLDEAGRPVSGVLVEVWQANAAGRYIHRADQHHAPLDPNFHGAGRCLTDEEGWYRFLTVRPGPYPWQNHHNAWRPSHIHFSLFGHAFLTRLVTQMYFPGDPLLAHDPIFQAVPEGARERLLAAFDLALAIPEQATGYRFDIVLRGPRETPVEEGR